MRLKPRVMIVQGLVVVADCMQYFFYFAVFDSFLFFIF
jgi:hypothetical protein